MNHTSHWSRWKMDSSSHIKIMFSLITLIAFSASIVNCANLPTTGGIRVPATDCRLKNETLGIDIDFKQLASNASFIEIPNITVNGTQQTLAISLCQGIKLNSTDFKCGNRTSSTTNVCLFNSTSVKTSQNSRVIGTIITSRLRQNGNRITWESYPGYVDLKNQTIIGATNSTVPPSTRIEFLCSKVTDAKPIFDHYDNRTFFLNWSTPLACPRLVEQPKPQNVTEHIPTVIQKNTTTTSPKMQSTTTTTSTLAPTLNVEPVVQSPTKMNNMHRFFMISLIVMSLAAFMVIIFIMDKKTRFNIPLNNIRRQARQVFQPAPVPYSRVSDFNDGAHHTCA